jgi:hypothetical protein
MWATEIRRLKMRTSVPTDTSIQADALLLQKNLNLSLQSNCYWGFLLHLQLHHMRFDFWQG